MHGTSSLHQFVAWTALVPLSANESIYTLTLLTSGVSSM